MSDKIKVGVIGYGYWGPNLVRNFNALPDAEVCFIADKSTDALLRAHNQYPDIPKQVRPIYSGGAEPDAVVIATPVRSHYQLAMEAISHKKHVLAEKPMAMTSNECGTLHFHAGHYGLVMMVGHTFLFSDVVRYIKKQIGNGELGDILSVRITRTNLGLYRDDVNVAWDLAAHDIAMLNFFFGGPPDTVDAFGATHYGDLEDVAFINLTYGKTAGHIHVSWLDPNKVREVVIVGSKKMLVYDDLAVGRKIQIYDKGVTAAPYTTSFSEFQASYRHGDILIPAIQEGEPLKNEARHFIDCIKNGTDPISDGGDGQAVVRTLERINESMEKK